MGYKFFILCQCLLRCFKWVDSENEYVELGKWAVTSAYPSYVYIVLMSRLKSLV